MDAAAEPTDPRKPDQKAETGAASSAPVGRKVVLTFFAILFAAILYVSFKIFRPFLEIFIVAATTASLSHPLYERFTRKLGGRRNIGAALTLLVLVLMIVVPMTFYSSLLSREAVNLTEGLNAATIQSYLERVADRFIPEKLDLKSYFKNQLGPGGILESSYFKEAVNQVAGAANALLQGLVTGVASALIKLLVFFLFLFFLLRDGSDLGQELMRLSPLEDSAELEILSHLTRTIRAILIGGVLVPIVQGILAMIGFAVFGLPSPILWGSLLIVGAVVPIVGSTIVWIPATLYLALTAATWKWVGLLAYCTLLVSSADNILKPIILKEAADFHPLIAFISVLGGMAAFGIFGFILGPIIASLFLSLIRIYKYEVLKVPAQQGRS